MVSQIVTHNEKKKRLFKAAKLRGTPQSRAKHQAAEKAYCRALRNAKCKFMSCDLQSLIKNNPRKFWKSISPTNTDDDISLVDDDGINVSPNDCATMFNNYFTSVFTKEDHFNIP